MLAYACELFNDELNNAIAVESEDFDNIHEFFAKILIKQVKKQIKHGLHRDYIPIQEDLSGVRGRININETIKQQTLIKGRLVCAFDEFSANTHFNQTLKCVLLLFIRHATLNEKIKQEIRGLLRYFAEVSEIEPPNIRWDSFNYHRNNVSYRMLIYVCKLVVKSLLVTKENGTHSLKMFNEPEEMQRSEIYKRFVLGYYKYHYPELTLSHENRIIAWDIMADNEIPLMPTMATDIILSNGAQHLIIETKFYYAKHEHNNNETEHIILRPNHTGSPKYNWGNLYQMYAYLANYAKMHNLDSEQVSGLLLYAKTNDDEAKLLENTKLTIAGSSLELAVLDLSQDWNIIEKKLEEVVLILKCS